MEEDASNVEILGTEAITTSGIRPEQKKRNNAILNASRTCNSLVTDHIGAMQI
jgi:hypothetical protein